MRMSDSLRSAVTMAAVLGLRLLVNPGLGSAVTVGAQYNVPKAMDKVRIQESYGKLPLYFIRNDGQLDPKVKFYERGSGRTIFFTDDGVYILLERMKDEGGRMNLLSSGLSTQHSVPKTQMVKLLPVGTNKSPKIIAEGMQEGKVNYFIGKDPKKWRTNIPTYKSVLYQEAYKGIDLRFYGNNRQMEYDIVVKPGADPSQVKLAYEGVEGLRIAQNGDLEIMLKDGGKLIQKKPYVYQEINGKRRELAGRFNIDVFREFLPKPVQNKVGFVSGRIPETQNVKSPVQSYSFEIASYDKSKPLFIDPLILVYSTYLGGSGNDYSDSIAIDGNGCAYIIGQTSSSTGFPINNAVQSHYGSGSDDVFVTKISADGTALAYSTYLGGTGDDWGRGIAVDNNGNAYITGATSSTGFPVTNNAIQSHYGGGVYDVFVTKITSNGTALAYSTYLGGSGYDVSMRIAVDNNGNAYVAGMSASTNFPVTDNAAQKNLGGNGDAFVTKINADGTALAYSTYLGGSGDDGAWGIAVDSNHCAYVSGYTSSTNFPGTANSTIQSHYGGGVYDIFAAKITSNGAALAYSTYLGGSGTDSGGEIAVDSSGCAYVTGATGSTNFPVTNNAIQSHKTGSENVFVTKINADGTALAYSTYLGGSGDDQGGDIAVDSNGNAYITGYTSSTNFPIINSNIQSHYGGGSYDAFVTKINADGTAINYSTYLGGSGSDGGNGIAIDSNRNVYVIGRTNSTNFPITDNPIQSHNAGGYDAFVAKIEECSLPSTPATISYPSSSCSGDSFIVTWSAVSGAVSYTLQRVSNLDYTYGFVYSGSANSYIQTGLSNAIYHYRVRAGNSCGNSDWIIGSAIKVTSAPNIPDGIYYPAKSCSGSFTVHWVPASGATGYILQRDNSGLFTNPTLVYNGIGTSYSESSLGNGTYYYQVKAMNGCGDSGWNNGPAITVSSVPNAPDSIDYPSKVCGMGLTVSWTAVSGATGYTLQRSVISSFSPANTIYSGSNSSFNQIDLIQGTYYYRVKARSGCGSSDWRSGTAVILKKYPATPASMNYPLTNCTGGFTIRWAGSAWATGYTLESAITSAFSDSTVIYTGKNTYYAVSGVSDGTYYYRVRGENGCSGNWKTGHKITVASIPGIPASINYPSTICSSSFIVSWSPVAGAVHYVLQRAANSSFINAITVYNGIGSSYRQKNLGNGTYYYRVQAHSPCGSSGWQTGSAIVVRSIPATPASITYPVNNCIGSFIVRWSGVAWVDGYTLQRNDNGGEYSDIYTGSIRAYNEHGLASGTYSYRVKARSFCGDSDWRTGSHSITVPVTLGTASSLTITSGICSTTVSLKWTPLDGAITYFLQRARNAAFIDAATFNLGITSSCTQTKLGFTTYYYRVRARNYCGYSEWSNISSVTISLPPATPLNIGYPVNTCVGSFTVRWSGQGRATGYILQRAADASFSDASTVYSGSSLSYTEDGQISSGVHYYRVQAYNSCGNSGWKNGPAITAGQPEIPASISYPGNNYTGSFTVSWSSAKGANRYILQRSLSPTFTAPATVYTGSGLSYNQTGLGSGTYYYRVKAGSLCGTSDWENGGAIVVALPQ